MFFTSHPDSTREHLMGTYHCAHIGCPGTLDAHHKYLLEESSSDCSPCLARDGDTVDPEIVPVEYYPPVEDFDIEYVGIAGYQKVVKREKRKVEEVEVIGEEQEEDDKDDSVDLGDWRDDKDFSDIDSVTSHWRLDQNAVTTEPPAKDLKSPSPHTVPTAIPAKDLKSPSPLNGSAPPFSPEGSPENITPNASKHRHLVEEQLAKLPYYRTQPHPPAPRHQHQPSFGITRPPAHAFPVPVPAWPYRTPYVQQPQGPPGPHPFHAPSMIHGVPRNDHMLWHPVSHPDSPKNG
jgi:hypothetical protein